ncbi:site-specific integrase [Paraglaciecola agarilytica]|uniref:site-specific integrase n=1 Tax=Paraglaciecola chathamensis TaxID=368405 RepID=UPI001C0A1D5F|nr:site-specific integrase [Paraglaciecola agarilytica]MBU3020158.1 site-specific integrase [Paraglaciecola agarilytica]
MAYKIPYLIKNRNNNFYLRFMVPLKVFSSDIRRIEIRYSLKTKNFNVAMTLYNLVVPLITYRIRDLVEMERDLAESQAELRLLKSKVSHYIDEKIQKLIETSIASGKHWKTDLARRSLKQAIDDCMLEPLTELTIESSKSKNLASETKRESDRLELNSQNLIKSLTAAISHSAPTISPSSSTSENKPLHELLALYLDERKTSLSPRTYSQQVKTLERFIEIVGIKLLSNDLGNDELDRYSKVTKTIAPNVGNNSKVTKPTDSEDLIQYWIKLAENNTGKALASNGVEKHFSSVRPFLRWCFERHNIIKDYSTYPSLRKQKRATDTLEKTPFSIGQLDLIFGSFLYGDTLRQREQPCNYQFWLPLIALSTGMRIAEIVAIEKKDIYEQDNVWVIDVNDKWHSPKHRHPNHSKRKKNKSSCRMIPIPNTLLNAGFLSYVGALKTHDMLFPELSLGEHKGLGDYASKWFNERFLKYINLDKRSADGKQGVSFHSFRHGFVTNLDKTIINGVPLNDSERHYLTGHEQIGVRNKTYNHGGVNLEHLKEYMDAINHNVDCADINFKRYSQRIKVTK